MGKQLGGNGFRAIAQVIVDQYIKLARYSITEEIEYLLDSADSGCDDFLRACHLVFGLRYNAIFLAAQNACADLVVWLYRHCEAPGSMCESEILSQLDICNTEESAAALCAYALEQNHYTLIEPVLRKSHMTSACANRLYQSLDPTNKLRSYLAYEQREHTIDDEIYYLHAECSWPFIEIGIKLGLSPQSVQERYLIAERIRL